MGARGQPRAGILFLHNLEAAGKVAVNELFPRCKSSQVGTIGGDFDGSVLRAASRLISKFPLSLVTVHSVSALGTLPSSFGHSGTGLIRLRLENSDF